MRTFISINLSDEAVDEIKKIQKQLVESRLFEGKITEEENLHLTLKFLGEIDEKKVEEMRNRLRKVNIKRFKTRLGNIGVFSVTFLRIIWIKLEGQAVFELQKQIDEALSSLFEKEVRFMGHVTLARVKKVEDKDKLLGFLKKIKAKEVEFEVKNFKLMRSELFPQGPRYKVIEEFNLT